MKHIDVPVRIRSTCAIVSLQHLLPVHADVFTTTPANSYVVLSCKRRMVGNRKSMWSEILFVEQHRYMHTFALRMAQA